MSLIINFPPLKTTKYKPKYYKLRKHNMWTRTNKDIMQLIWVYSLIILVVYLNSNKNNINTCFQFTLKYIFSAYKT